MIQQIIGKIVAHKAGIALGAAAVGVVATAVLAAKDARKYDENIDKAELERDLALSDEEVEQMMKEQGIDDVSFIEYLNKKEKAIIFAKSYWRTGLSMAVTFALMIFSHVSMAKELAATMAALGAIGAKYKDLQAYLKENYPEQYKELMRKLDRKNARERISEKPLKKEETYDGRKRYYFPISDQIVFLKEEDWPKIQHFIDSKLGTDMECYLNEVLDYIHYDLNYKDVHISDVEYKWEFGEDTVCQEDFPSIIFEYDDVLDDDSSVVVCQVVRTSIEPELDMASERNHYGLRLTDTRKVVNR